MTITKVGLSCATTLGVLLAAVCAPSAVADEKKEKINPPVNPYPSYYNKLNDGKSLNNDIGIAPPINPYPQRQVSEDTQIKKTPSKKKTSSKKKSQSIKTQSAKKTTSKKSTR